MIHGVLKDMTVDLGIPCHIYAVSLLLWHGSVFTGRASVFCAWSKVVECGQGGGQA